MATGIWAWVCLFIFLFIISSPMTILLIFWLNDKKTYRVAWCYNRACYPSVTLVKAKNPYEAWRKVEKRHAIPIDLIEVSEYV